MVASKETLSLGNRENYLQWKIPCKLILQNPDGREAVVDFSGDAVEYRGDLPISEAAKVFFDAVGSLLRQPVKTDD